MWHVRCHDGSSFHSVLGIHLFFIPNMKFERVCEQRLNLSVTKRLIVVHLVVIVSESRAKIYPVIVNVFFFTDNNNHFR